VRGARTDWEEGLDTGNAVVTEGNLSRWGVPFVLLLATAVANPGHEASSPQVSKSPFILLYRYKWDDLRLGDNVRSRSAMLQPRQERYLSWPHSSGHEGLGGLAALLRNPSRGSWTSQE
jgi:hypothetical protein